MACDYDRQKELERAKQAALKDLMYGNAKIRKNPLSGKIEISGMNPASKNGCGDACIIASIARLTVTQPAIARYFRAAGIQPQDAIKSHQQSHRHGAHNHAH